jgi:Ca2+-transporting ATPase
MGEVQRPFHSMPVEEVVRALGVDPSRGLSAEEVERRRRIYGPNRIIEVKRPSPFLLFLNQYRSVLVMILLAATVVSAALGDVIEAAVIGVILLFIGFMGFLQEYRAERALERLRELTAPWCRVLRDGEVVVVPSEDLVPGDVLVLGEGDVVAADGRVIESSGLRVDESPLTGESAPVDKRTEPLPEETPMADRTNCVYAGTLVVSGKGKAVVTATGRSTELGKIAEYTGQVREERTPLEARMEDLGKKFGILALVIIATLFAAEFVESVLAGDASLGFLIEVFLFSVALAVAAVPEALPAIVTASLAIGAWTLAKHGALVRKLSAVESLGSTQVMCFDKTGTLTRGEQTVRALYIDRKVLRVEEQPSADGSQPSWPSTPTFENLLRAIVLCNDARLSSGGKRHFSGDPTEVALLQLAAKAGVDPESLRSRFQRVAERPFSSDRMLMSTVNLVDGKRVSHVKGAAEVVLARCDRIMLEGEVRPLGEQERIEVLQVNEQLASEGMRVLAVAVKELRGEGEEDPESGLTFLGLVGLIDPPRPGAVEAIASAKSAGVVPVMITGDHRLTAVSIARECGIDVDMVLTGKELERMSADELAEVVERVRVYARTTPSQKLKIVEAWKKKDYVVAMTGDGVNDAPALKRADIGVAMGIRGTEVAKEASDIILTDDSLPTLVKAIELGRWIFDNIKKYLAYLLQANLVEIVVLSVTTLVILRALGYSGEESLALLPVHILYINLATDGLPALALGVSPPDPDLMKRPPPKRGEGVLSRDVIGFLVRAVIVESPLLIAAFYLALPMGIEAARTRLFLLFIAIELVVALNCRSLRHSVLKVRPHKWLVIAVLWELLLITLLVSHPVTRTLLHLTVPTVDDVLWCVAGGLATFASIEALKHISSKSEPAHR